MENIIVHVFLNLQKTWRRQHTERGEMVANGWLYRVVWRPCSWKVMPWTQQISASEIKNNHIFQEEIKLIQIFLVCFSYLDLFMIMHADLAFWWFFFIHLEKWSIFIFTVSILHWFFLFKDSFSELVDLFSYVLVPFSHYWSNLCSVVAICWTLPSDAKIRQKISKNSKL